MNNWIQTFTGKKFFPTAPTEDSVDIRDIAHALSLKCRFAGHCLEFYSIAEHSVRVSDIVEPESKMLALLHDAPEAYLPDVASPIKREVFFAEPRGTAKRGLVQGDFSTQPADMYDLARVHIRLSLFGECEEILLRVILRALKVPFSHSGPIPDDVKAADLILLKTEARDLLGKPPEPWAPKCPVLSEKIVPLPPKDAEELFLQRFRLEEKLIRERESSLCQK